MKKLRIESASMCVRVEYDFSLLNDNLKLTAGYQCFLYKKDDGEFAAEVDFCDVENITFMGMDIESGHVPYREWKNNMLKIGINISEITNKACYNSVVKNNIERYLKETYKKNYFGSGEMVNNSI